MITWEPIKKHLGAKIKSIAYKDAMSLEANQWRELLYARNVIVIENVSLTRQEFYNFSFKFGAPWSRELHALHGEEIESDMVVNWSDKTGLKKVNIPWHTDNSWHSKWRNPIRMLYSVQIPDPNSGSLNYLDLSYVYNYVLSDVEREEIQNWRVLIQDYRDPSQKNWYPLVEINPITGAKSVLLTALDLDSPAFGFTKAPGYQKGHTFLLRIEDQHGREQPLQYLIDYGIKCMKAQGCWFEQKWKTNMLQVISNQGIAHCRTTLSNTTEERLIWRKTIAHHFQGSE